MPNIVGRTPCGEEGKPSGSHQHEQLGEMAYQIESIYKRITTTQNITQHDALIAQQQILIKSMMVQTMSITGSLDRLPSMNNKDRMYMKQYLIQIQSDITKTEIKPLPNWQNSVSTHTTNMNIVQQTNQQEVLTEDTI